MNRRVAVFLISLAIQPAPLRAQRKDLPCAVKFSVAVQDALGNVDIGLSPEDQKWFAKKVMKRYPGVCYVEQEANVGTWFYISVSTKDKESATATTQTYSNGDGTSTSNTRVTPRTTTYPVYTLKIGRFKEGKLEVLRTFQETNADSGGGVTGLIDRLGSPRRDVIQDAVDWLSWTEIPDSEPKSKSKKQP